MASLSFEHVFAPPAEIDDTTPILVLLHSTGGNQHQLVTLGQQLAPKAAILSPLGQVNENGFQRFFKRYGEGKLDLDDLARQAERLNDFVREASEAYGFSLANIIAGGYSNGANAAVGMFLSEPSPVRSLLLFRAMISLQPEPMPTRPSSHALVSAGRFDQTMPPDNPERLTAILQATGASVTLTWQSTGHQLTEGDVATAREWFANLPAI